MTIDDAFQIDMLRKMLLIRAFEEQARDFFMRNLMRGSTHMYIGEEAVAVGVCSALRKDDYIASTHRGHGHSLAKGSDPRAMMAELLGKDTGYCGGKGGSMHIADHSLGNLGANGIVGAGIGLATGAAFAARYRGEDRVAVAFFGDGAINQGIFAEAANMAALWKLPVIYVCERNRFAEFSYTDRYFSDPDLTKRSIPYGFPGVEIDGNDVLAVYTATEEAVARARRGEGPTLIVADTYRIMGHTIGDPLTYRVKGEVDQWLSPERDPIARFEQHLLAEEITSYEMIEEIKKDVRRTIEAAAEFALASPEPQEAALFADVYAPQDGRAV
jgi:TPP-dependent pyruvate/acetoin dehydrogenase alpha subunit